MRKRKMFSKVISWVLMLVMVFTLAPGNLMHTLAAESAGGGTSDTTITVHFKPDAALNWSQVYAKLAGGSSWKKLNGWEFMANDSHGGKVSADTSNEGWYSYQITISSENATEYAGNETGKGLVGLFNCGEWGATKQTNNFEMTDTVDNRITFTVGTANEVWFTAIGQELTKTVTSPDGWVSGGTVATPEAEVVDTPQSFTYVKLHFLNYTNYTTPAINCWDANASDVEVTADGKIEIAAWGNQQNKMTPEADNYYVATLKAVGTTGNISGIQIIDAPAEQSTYIQLDSSALETINGCKHSESEEPTDLYYAYGTVWKSQADITIPSVTSCDLTIHFQNSANWDKVFAKFGAGSNWDAIPGAEYCKNNAYGGKLTENDKNPGWYSYKIHLNTISDINGLFNAGNWDIGQTENYTIPMADLNAEAVELWLSTGSGENKANVIISKAAPIDWDTTGTVTAPINPSDTIAYASPIVNADGSVTIVYDMNDASAPVKDITNLYLMGTATDWNNGKPMALENGKFSITINKPDAQDGDIVVTPGTYQYKFKTDAGEWFADPANKEISADGNSIVHVPGMVVNGQSTAGSGTFAYSAVLQSADGSAGEITAWAVSTNPDTIEAPAGISIAMDAENSARAVLTATDEAADGYYYVIVNYTVGGETKSQAVKYYHTGRAVIYEYAYKEDSENKGKSDFYSWYNSPETTGYRFIPDAEDAAKGTAYVPLDKNVSSFGYIIRLYGEWGENDREYTDRTLVVNEGERYTKVRGGEGIEEPYVLSTGKTGYDNGIVFRYRDDALFYSGQMDTIQSAKVMVKAPGADAFTAYDMAYDAENELYTYALKNSGAALASGDYSFYFVIDGQSVSDDYYVPENAQTVDGAKVAVIPFANYDYDISAKVTPENGASSDQNPVVEVKISRTEDGKTVDAVAQGEIAQITADISSLGFAGQTVAISPVTGKGTLYVKEGLPAGRYQVPFSVADIYGMKHEGNAVVKVVNAADSADDWDESVIYFLLTDRFYDGNTANNVSSAGVPVDKSVREDYHGGDFAGLTQKLDYIKSLGVNTIWITPVVDNIESFASDETGTDVGGYAGYWACDFTKLDEHLGTTAEYDRLLDEAHARGIKVMLDIVVNHAGYDKTTEAGEWQNPDSAFNGMIRPKAEAGSDSVTQWLSDLPDFMTENRQVRSRLVAWQKAWATHTTAAGNSVDYFRVDTVKHVDHETWNELKSEITAEKPDFKMIGEYFGASATNTGDYLGNGEMDSLLDFDFKSLAGKFVNGNIDEAETALEARNTRLNNAITMGQFLSSHDEIGFLESVGGDTGKMKIAAALELTAKGQPIIYYGEEINLTGDTKYGSDGNNRYDMQFDNLTEEQSAMLAHYKKLIAARNAKTAVFAKGDRKKLAGSDSEGYVVFQRSCGEDRVFVALNTTDEAKEITFAAGDGLSDIKDLYSGQTYAVIDGNVTVTIPAKGNGGTVILATENKTAGNTSSGTDYDTTVSEPEKPDDTEDVTPVPEKTKPKKVGTVITVKNSQAKVRVTSAKASKPTVAFMRSTKSTKTATSVKVPATVRVDGVTYKVTSIAPNAFRNYKKLKTVFVGANIELIGKNAFANCISLTKITLPCVKEIQANTFYGCKRLKTMTIKSTVLKTVGKNALKGIYPKATIRVPKKQYKAYAKLLKNKGQKSTVKIKPY